MTRRKREILDVLQRKDDQPWRSRLSNAVQSPWVDPVLSGRPNALDMMFR
jgi:hypothetical protein